jgi:hypothetical protein
MADVEIVEPVIRFCAVISRRSPAIDWAIARLSGRWGDVIIRSPDLPFDAGGYYREAMGADLTKTLVAFSRIADPGQLADWKLDTNGWETEYASSADHAVSRPLNLDPGYITQAKLVLATTKDRDHRLYLRDGIFGEVTLNYTRKQWVHHRWTYPDYRTAAVAEFADRCRRYLREHLKTSGAFRRRHR